MSTRGAMGFRMGGEDKITYNHMDSYPTGRGTDVVEFIKTTPIEKMVDAFGNIIMVSEEDKPTPEQIEECRKFLVTDIGGITLGSGSVEDWYNLLRLAQGHLDVYLNGLRYMIEYSGFLYDSLFCEYAYIINLDDKTLEFYVGGNKNTGAPGRYAAAPADYLGDDGYVGVRLADTVSLADIQKMDDEGIEALIHKWDTIR